MRTKLGPVWPCVRFWEPSRDAEHQRSPKQALLSQRGAAVNEQGRPDEPKKDEMQSPVGGGVKEADRARQRRKELARKLAKISPLTVTYPSKIKQWRGV